MGKGRAIRKNDNGWNNRPTKETKFYTVRGKIRPCSRIAVNRVIVSRMGNGYSSASAELLLENGVVGYNALYRVQARFESQIPAWKTKGVLVPPPFQSGRQEEGEGRERERGMEEPPRDLKTFRGAISTAPTQTADFIRLTPTRLL